MKERLLRAVEEAQAREGELVALCADTQANPDGTWTAKDHLAHLAWHRDHNSARTIEAIRTGGELPIREDDYKVEMAAINNAAIYDASKDLSLTAVKADAKRSWDALQEALAACTEEDLLKQHPRIPGSVLWELVPSHAGHVGAHVWSCLLDRGDVERAGTVALWAHGIETEFTPEPGKRADADYNLACFYARTGQPRAALPLLRQSFESKRELAAWAHEDADLDPIRDDPELKELLGT